MKVLVIQTAYIGDVILATSLSETIAELMPGCQIDFLVRNGNESLLKNNPGISKVYVWNKKKKLRSLLANLLEIRREKYDAVFNIQRFINSGILTGLSGAKSRVGFKQNPASFLFSRKIQHKIPHLDEGGNPLHEVQRNAQLLTPVFKNCDPLLAKAPRLYFNQEIENKVEAICAESMELHKSQGYIVLAPTSVWYTKQWSEAKWKELTQSLSQTHSLFFIGAPADSEAIDKIIGQTKNCVNLAGRLSLLESAKLMQAASRVFVNDSAPLHLASSVNAKTTAIFCSTIPEFGYTPLSDDSIVISREPRLSCQPCGLHGKKECPLGHFKCSMDISVEKVANTAK